MQRVLSITYGELLLTTETLQCTKEIMIELKTGILVTRFLLRTCKMIVPLTVIKIIMLEKFMVIIGRLKGELLR